MFYVVVLILKKYTNSSSYAIVGTRNFTRVVQIFAIKSVYFENSVYKIYPKKPCSIEDRVAWSSVLWGLGVFLRLGFVEGPSARSSRCVLCENFLIRHFEGVWVRFSNNETKFYLLLKTGNSILDRIGYKTVTIRTF